MIESALVATADSLTLTIAATADPLFQIEVPETGVLVVRIAQVLSLLLLAAGIATVAGFVFRWYAHDTLAEGIAILLGLSGIALVLNTTAALGLALSGEAEAIENDAVFTLAAFAAGTVGSDLGRRLGDLLGSRFAEVSRLPSRLDTEVSQLVKAKGRVLRVTLPEEIGDIDGYDPVPPETKTNLAGETLLFPRRITQAELRTRIVDRLKNDYDVGHVDVDLDETGSVQYLAVGSRAAGIGPTIDPGSVAIAIRADPAYAASPGDHVEVWRPGETPTRIARGELRAAVKDVVTIVVDAEDAAALAPEGPYKLVTTGARPNVDREFASLLRSADETMSAITIETGSSLVGSTPAGLKVTIAAIRGAEDVDALPTRSRIFAPGDVIYAVGRPDRLRKLEAAARGVPPEDGAIPAPTVESDIGADD